MRILLVNQFYWPDAAATAQQMADLAEWLVERGHEVTVYCSRGQYQAGSTRRAPRYQVHHGVKIRRLAIPSLGKKSFVARLLEYAGFHLLCGLRMGLAGWRYDAIVTLTTPPLIGLYATLVKWLTFGRTKHVCWSMDLHPDCEFALGMWSPRHPLYATLNWLNGLHFRKAHASVALGDCMAGRLRDKGVAADRCRVIGVWSRADQIEPRPLGSSPLAEEHGLAGKFVVMYSGNAGLAHTFDAVNEAMLRLKADDRIRFLFVGAGKRLDEVEAFAKQHELANFLRLPYFPREQLNDSLALGDVHLATLIRSMAGIAVPCKTYGIMAAGRAMLFVGPDESEIAQQVRAADCGYVIDPTDADALVARIRELADDRETCQRLGANGRAYMLAHHERQVCCDQWTKLLEEVTG